MAGGVRAPDRRPRPPAGPGKQTQRTDLSKVTPGGLPAQGVYAPNVADSPDLQYGDASRLSKAQTSVPLPSASVPPAPGPEAPAGSGGGRSAPAPAPGAQPGLTPQDILAMVSGHPTDYPNQSLAASPAPASGSLAFKIDALRYLSTLPFAGPEIQTLLSKAQIEYDQAQRQSFMPSAPAAPPPASAAFNTLPSGPQMSTPEGPNPPVVPV